MTLWPNRSIPPRPSVDPSEAWKDSDEQARFIASIEERTARERERDRERERRERRDAEALRPPPPPPRQVQTPVPQRGPPPRTPQRMPPRLMPAQAQAERDLLEVGRPREPRRGEASAVDAILPSRLQAGATTGARPTVRLSDAVPPEAQARIEGWLRTGRIDDTPFSFAPLDPLVAAPPPRSSFSRPPEPEPPAPLPRGETPETPATPRLPFEADAPLPFPGNRFDLLPVSLPAVTLGSRAR